MSKVIIFNKPFGVISQFSPNPPHQTLKDFIHITDVYPAGRLDTDSEGLMILTNDGKLQAQVTEPKYKKYKQYLVQVEGVPSDEQIALLQNGVYLGDFTSSTAIVQSINEPESLWSRNPPVRFRKSIPTSWISLSICEGKNRQVRRMTAKVGLPTLRLIRVAIGGVMLANLQPGEWRELAYLDFIQQFQQA